MSFLECKALCIVINFLVLWSICLSSPPLSIKRMILFILQQRLPNVYLFDEFSASELSFESFLVFLRYAFLFHPSSLFVWWCQLVIFPSTCSFLLFMRPNAVLIWQVHSFCFFLLSHFSLFAWYIFNAKFHSYILALYLYCLYQGIQFFFIFCKYLYVILLHKGINLFLRFWKFRAPCTFPKWLNGGNESSWMIPL